MFINANLSSHLESTSTIEIESAVLSEINMNIADNIQVIGNYKNRPSGTPTPAATSFSKETSSTVSPKYYGYTDSDVVVDGGYDSADLPISFISTDKKKNLLFSLEDCFLKFRPRSGINKAMFYGSVPGHYIHNSGSKMMKRPRYYMAHKNDPFKYWTSFRVESEVISGNQYTGVERGITKTQVSGKSEYYIDDAAPFIVYNEAIPVNRVILKIQTNIGSATSGQSFSGTELNVDPLYSSDYKTVPMTWKIQYLHPNGTDWVTAKQFTSEDVFGTDGYLELHYAPSGWSVKTSTPSSDTLYLTELTNPTVSDLNAGKYNQFQYIRGLRVVVDTLKKKDATFDLIEMSPRLACDFSSIVSSYSVNKIASDLNTSGLPLGDLLASTGTLEMLDYDQAFNENNNLVYTNTSGTGSVQNSKGSVIAKYIGKNMQVKLYEVIKNVELTEGETTYYSSFYVPIKTLYADTFPEINKDTRAATLQLRDLFFYFETLNAPELLIKDVSFSYAVAMLFDSIGFSNYIYLKSVNDEEPSIPFFYSSPNTSVAEVLQQLARSAQTAMFFNEDNDLVIMSRSYMLPNSGDRNPSSPESEVSKTLYGSDDIVNNKLADVISISDQSKDIFNDGKINYTTRYIQKSYSELRQAQLVDSDKAWNYKPALLWEVSPTDTTKSINEEKYSQSSYTLSAIPLNSNLSNEKPTVVNKIIQNNVMDLGEGVYWISRYNGYFYAHGEIIRYDAVEFSIPGLENPNVWVSSREEYQKYFAEIPFGGKMYPTGRVRIYVEPNYDSDGSFKNGAVAKHGREQFGTKIASHNAGLDSYWTNNTYVRGISMDSKLLFGVTQAIDNVYTKSTVVGVKTGSAAGQISLVIADADKSIPFSATDAKYQLIVGYAGTESFIEAGTKIISYDKTTQIIKFSKPLIGAIPNNAKIAIKEYQNDFSVVSQPDLPKIDASKKAGWSVSTNTLASKTNRNSIIRNYLSSEYLSEDKLKGLTATQSGTIQSSALIMSGPTVPSDLNPLDHVSYIYKQTDSAYKHFGCRVRILGTPQNDSGNAQIPTGSAELFTLSSTNSEMQTTISGASGGMAVMVNPEKNIGYYFEITALTTNDFQGYVGADQIANVFFYKIMHNSSDTTETAPAVPEKLWAGLTTILVDDGMFTGQYRFKGDKNSSVYDLAVEYENIADNVRKFYLYINNKLVGTVYDSTAIPVTNNMAIFVRGGSRLMFENIFAIGSTGPQEYSDAPLRAALELNKETETDEGVRKYMLPDSISASYLSGLSPIAPPKQAMYFEEFGTIMRECAYFNIKYNKAYPALISKIAPTFNKIKGYAVSGYSSGAYGAEFLIFNTTDTVLSLEESSGNYLRILGITFTQESSNEYTVDDHYSAATDFSNVDENFNGNTIVTQREAFQKIKNSRMTYGKKQFNINAEYIQDYDSARSLMGWLLKKVTNKRKAIGVDIFPNPTIQLGDIVTINYKRGGIDQVASVEDRFVVYNITYKRDGNGPAMTLYLMEVADA